jgi:hypothetical protein
LIGDALFKALGCRPGLRCERRGSNVLLFPDPAVVKSSVFHVGDTKAIDYISGTVRGTSITWTEACSLRLDYRLDRLWLLMEPLVRRTIPEGTSEKDVDLSREFVRERQARRRNKADNPMIDGWSRLIAGDASTLRLRSFNISDGYDGDFELMRVSGFSGVAS